MNRLRNKNIAQVKFSFHVFFLFFLYTNFLGACAVVAAHPMDTIKVWSFVECMYVHFMVKDFAVAYLFIDATDAFEGWFKEFYKGKK